MIKNYFRFVMNENKAKEMIKSTPTHAKLTFEEEWLEKTDEMGDKFKMWLLPNYSESSEAICAICSWKKIDIKRGLPNIVAHSKTKRHKHFMRVLHNKRSQEFEVSR